MEWILQQEVESLQQRSATQVLSFVLFLYMSAVTIVVTLIPFRFAFPIDHAKFSLFGGAADTVLNIFLFIPLGFLYHLINFKKKIKWQKHAFLFGISFSSIIEFLQLFLEKRCTSPSDILMNGLGALLGAYIYQEFSSRARRLNQQSVGLIVLDLPVTNIFYLLIPQLWLNSLATGKIYHRYWQALLIGLIGVIIVSEIYSQRKSVRQIISPTGLAGFTSAWYIIGSALLITKQPLIVLLIGCFLGVLTFLLAQTSKQRSAQIRSLEINIIKKIIPVFMVYLIGLTYFPLVSPQMPWQFSFGLSAIPEDPSNVIIFSLLEYLAAFSLFGFMISQWLATSETALLKKKVAISGIIFGVAGVLELFRGFHPFFESSFTQYLLADIAGFAGILIYRVQLGSVRKILMSKYSPNLRSVLVK